MTTTMQVQIDNSGVVPMAVTIDNPLKVNKVRKTHVPWWSHMVQMIPMISIAVLIVIGFGFHLRQGWVFYLMDKNNKSHRYACSVTPNEPGGSGGSMGNGYMGNGGNKTIQECLMPLGTEDKEKEEKKKEEMKEVKELRGYHGFLSMGMWKHLGMSGTQWTSLGLVVLAIVIKFYLAFTTYDNKQSRPQLITLKKPWRLLPFLSISFIMTVVFALQVYSSTCNSYPARKLAQYDLIIHNLIESKKQKIVPNDSDPDHLLERVVECYVLAYAGAGSLALFMAMVALVDARIIYKESRRVKVSGLKKGEDDSHSVTLDQMYEHGHPDEHIVGGMSGPHAPVTIGIQGGTSGQVVISNYATLIKSNELCTPDAKKARASFKKDKSQQEFDPLKKDMVFQYLNKEGGSLLDPVDKNYYKIKPGELDVLGYDKKAPAAQKPKEKAAGKKGAKDDLEDLFDFL